MVNNGFPNPCLKYSHLLNPVMLELTSKISNKYFTYHEKEDGGYYSRNDFYACNRVLINRRTLWKTNNESEYIGQVHIYGEINTITLCFLNGDIKHLTKVENTYIAKNKINLNIKSDVEDFEGQKYTIKVYEIGNIKYINYKSNSVYLFKKVFEFDELIWKSNNFSESAKSISICIMKHEKYLGILLTNFNYLLYQYINNNWINITNKRLRLNKFMLIFNINSGLKRFKNVPIDYETDLMNLEYSLFFNFTPEFEQNLDITKPKCLTYNLITNDLSIVLCNGNKIPIDTNKALIKIPINPVNSYLFPSKSFSEFTFNTAKSSFSTTSLEPNKNSIDQLDKTIDELDNSIDQMDNPIGQITNSIDESTNPMDQLNVEIEDEMNEYISVTQSEEEIEQEYENLTHFTRNELFKALSRPIEF
ncbi:uncharacterized protein TA13965 [Theileria annulata]|uniref:Uncharacterized protein n=1 Tax=Theileria annulata TaxID=5874 RepID=Q4UET4_THEAN|nr:uncharacterized protein TA13965 [Theileria annulata]CAI74405.1 hypothetical protein TA13965 [Theileria annulata]|eukprot:XP_952137.1 hypothetical protein TA13965 [Theileria annulata]